MIQKSKGLYRNHLKKMKDSMVAKLNKVRENEIVIAILATTLFWIVFWLLFIK